MSHAKVPDQPDRIEFNSRELPDARRAARRVRAYIGAAGDGLYDTCNPGDGPRPLYGRDLEILCRVVILVAQLTHDTDGEDLDPDTEIPVGEVMRALAGESL